MGLKIVILAMATALSAPDDLSQRARKHASLPGDVLRFIERRTECNHFAGEDPYDAERAKQLDLAMRELRCSRIEADELTLRRKHARDPAVLKALTETRDDTL